MSVASEDRIIGGQCECCEVFYFVKKGEPDTSQTDQLDNLITNYSSRQRGDAVEAGRIFARAAGFSEADVAQIGGESPQHFEWGSQSANDKVFFSVEVHLTKRASLWHLYFNLGTGLVRQ